MGPIAKEIREVEDQHLGDERGEGRIGGSGQLDGPEDGEFQHVPLVPEGVVRIDLDADPPAGLGRELLAEAFETPHHGLVRGRAGAGPDHEVARRPAAAPDDDRRGGQREEGGPHAIPSHRGRKRTTSGNAVISARTATIAATGRTVQRATSPMLLPAMVQDTNSVAP